MNRLPECDTYPLAPAKKLSIPRETVYTCVGLIFTIATSVMVQLDMDPFLRFRIATASRLQLAGDLALVLIIYYLIFGTVLYFVCRLGYLKRLATHRPASHEELESIYNQARVPLLAILVPSYKEEEEVVRQTMMSAALMEYPDRDITLLIDDPPDARDPESIAALKKMRRLPGELEKLFRPQKRRYEAALSSFEQRRTHGLVNLTRESRRVANLYRDVAGWLETQAAACKVRDHTDELFHRRILLEPARAHRRRADEFERRCRESGVSDAELLHEYRRLAALFGARFASFERKRFTNLSHAPNKAMNLNSYLGLMGGSFREVIHPAGRYIEACAPQLAQFTIPRPDYVVTLDADSLLLFDYAMRLVHIMEQPGGDRFAVVQTPYTAIPGSRSILERTAGAQTDLQWLMGQGATIFNATFWVGASALLRRSALEEICQIEYERGHPISKYVRDRTLVEDTESSLDLIAAGWQLYNYPDRLCYSATPPDFGALIIQRRRWANGGLLVLPNLFRYLIGSPRRIKKIPEAIIRTQYLVSTAAVNVAMLALILVPFDKQMPYFWLMLTPIAYYLIYGHDLVLANYSWSDLPRVFALNLLLIPVNLGGVAKSLHQWLTTRQTPFVRTPKVSGRTAVPALYIFLTWAIFWYAYVESLIDIRSHRYLHAWFALFNAAVFVYATLRFVGLMRCVEDTIASINFRLRSIFPRRQTAVLKTYPQ